MTLDLYIARHVLAGVLAVFCLLASLFFIGDLIDGLDDLGRGDYGLLAALEFVTLRTPGRMHELLPAAALIGGLLGLGWLERGGELTAMRAAGASVARLTRAAMQAGALIVAAAVVLGEWIAPPAERIAYEWRNAALVQQVGLRSGAGFWGRDGLRFFHLGEVLPDGRLRDVRVFEFTAEGALALTLRARRAAPAAGDEGGEEAGGSGGGRRGKEWRFEEVEVSRFADDASRPVAVERLEAMPWRLPAGTGRLDAFAVRPRSLSTPELLAYMDHLRENGLRTVHYEVALWSRTMAPAAAAAMLFAAVVLVLGPLRHASLGLRTMAGIGAGIGFHIVQKVAVQSSMVHDWPVAAAAVAPVAALAALGWWWLRRTAA